jgi:hypothetical protein
MNTCHSVYSLHKPAIFTIAMKKLLLLAIALVTLCTAQARDARGDTLDIISYQLRLNITDFNTKILGAGPAEANRRLG